MFYDELKHWCGQKGTTPNRVAVECGLSEAAPSYWKRTGSTPKGEILEALAKHLDIPMEYLLDHTKADKDSSPRFDEINFVAVIMPDNGLTGDLIPRGAHLTLSDVEPQDGDIVAVSINGNTTVRHYKRDGKTIILYPSNPKYEVICQHIGIMSVTETTILGVVTEVRFKI